MSKDIKKLLDKITGKEVNHINVVAVSPWNKTRTRLKFDIEINKANFGVFDGDNYITMYIIISNRTVDDEVNKDEFEYQFYNSSFLENLKETIYDKYKLELLSVELDNVDIEYEYL